MYACAALFATLLNFKHIFVYLALPFVVFLFRRHCFTPAGKPAPLVVSSHSADWAADVAVVQLCAGFKFDRLVELGLIVASICAISFGPFVLAGGFSQLPQIVSRLFPFQRGLNHAYWAGNVWALVSATDRVLVKCEQPIQMSSPLSARPLIRPRRARPRPPGLGRLDLAPGAGIGLARADRRDHLWGPA